MKCRTKRRNDEKTRGRDARRLFAAVAIGALALAPSGGDAQRGGVNPNRPPVQGGARGRGPLAEQQIGRIMQQQLQLSPAQVPRLQELTARYSERRQALFEEERSVRMQMREVLCSTDSTRGGDMARWIDQMFELERRRLDLRTEEQRDAAAFLTPYQRARYLGLAEQIGRRLEEQLGPGGPGRGQGAGGRGAGRAGLEAGGPPQGGRPPGGALPGGPPPEGRGGPPPVDACGNPFEPGGRGRGRVGRGGEGGEPILAPTVYSPFFRP